MFRKEIPGSIAMIVDSGASHILLRQEHAHVLQNVICNTSRNYATITCAKQGAKITVIGTGSLTIGRFRFRAFICRDDELQHSLLGLNPLMEKGCTAEFTDKFFKLNHTACLLSLQDTNISVPHYGESAYHRRSIIIRHLLRMKLSKCHQCPR